MATQSNNISSDAATKIAWARNNASDPAGQLILQQAAKMYPHAVADLIPQNETMLQKAGDVAAPVVSTIEGAANVLNPVAIPGNVERLGRGIVNLATEPRQMGEGLLGKIGRSFSEANNQAIIPAPSLGESAAAIRSAPGLVGEIAGKAMQGKSPSLDAMANIVNQELATQKKYDVSESNPTAYKVGEVGAMAVGAVSLLKGIAKTALKVPAAFDTVKNFISNSGAEEGFSDAMIKQALQNADTLPEYKHLNDRFLTEKASDFTDVVDQYKQAKSLAYEQAMTPILEAKGKVKIPTQDLISEVRDTLGQGDNISPSMKRYLTGLMEIDLNDKQTIDFSAAQRIKQEISNKFGAYNRKFYLGAMPDDAIAARGITNSLRNSINDKVPEVVPINQDYSNGSVLLDSLNHVIGKPDKFLTDGPKGLIQATEFPNASSGIIKSMQPNQVHWNDAITKLGDLYPQAQPTIDDFRNFVAAKEIYSGMRPGIAGGLRFNEGKNPSLFGKVIESINPKEFSTAIKLLGFSQRPYSTLQTVSPALSYSNPFEGKK